LLCAFLTVRLRNTTGIAIAGAGRDGGAGTISMLKIFDMAALPP
jgi:hypothetical protein